jgi:hypothetical protein
MEENPFESPIHDDEEPSVEAELADGEQVLFEIAARSPSRRGWLLGLRHPVIGKFLVTNRRVVFLSSGTNGDLHFGITDGTMVRRIAASVEFASMAEESSWEFELPGLRSAEAPKPSIWTDPQRRLVLTGTDRSGLEVTHKVFPCSVKRKAWKELVARINELLLPHSSGAG